LMFLVFLMFLINFWCFWGLQVLTHSTWCIDTFSVREVLAFSFVFWCVGVLVFWCSDFAVLALCDLLRLTRTYWETLWVSKFLSTICDLTFLRWSTRRNMFRLRRIFWQSDWEFVSCTHNRKKKRAKRDNSENDFDEKIWDCPHRELRSAVGNLFPTSVRLDQMGVVEKKNIHK
jgi:hypothetical protein